VSACLDQGRARDAAHDLKRAGRRGQARAAGRRRLRARRRHHRHLTLTGGASTFAGDIIEIGEDNLFLSLLLTMITCLVLGMGIPTIPNYIITSSIAAPGAAGTRRAADRQPHVRVLLRHHGRPDAAGGAGRLRRGADRQGGAGLLLVLALPWTDEAGFALAAAWIGWHWWRGKDAMAA
jgi:hypothetical protein